jgi:hypothetical protein
MRSVVEGDQIVPEQPLWRYFKLDRLIQSVTSRTLYFPSARQFDDPFEGAVAVMPYDWPVDPRYAEMDYGEKAFEELRRLTKITSWHNADYESDAMWRLYAEERKGVAIRTTAERLQAGLLPFRLQPTNFEEEPFWGNVHYVDLVEVRLRVNMLARFFYKHRAFEWEREFRVAISVRLAEEYGVEVPELGIEVPIDPSVLIESIWVGPRWTEMNGAV